MRRPIISLAVNNPLVECRPEAAAPSRDLGVFSFPWGDCSCRHSCPPELGRASCWGWGSHCLSADWTGSAYWLPSFALCVNIISHLLRFHDTRQHALTHPLHPEEVLSLRDQQSPPLQPQEQLLMVPGETFAVPHDPSRGRCLLSVSLTSPSASFPGHLF